MSKLYGTLGSELWEELRVAFASGRFQQKYVALSHVLALVFEAKGLWEGHAFRASQLQYLIDRYAIPNRAANLIYALGSHLQEATSYSEDTHSATLYRDLYALCLLLYYVYPGSVVPDSLQKLFGEVALKGSSEPEVANIAKGYLRVEVERSTDAYIEGVDVQTGQTLRIDIRDRKEAWGEWQSFRKYLHPRSQIHVVHPRGSAECLFADLLIYEPDYLVNISSIAACFQPEGTSVLQYLYGKFQPQHYSWQIELGNLAGELLDLEVHRKPFVVEDIIRRFAQKKALICASLGNHFENIVHEAHQQAGHIAHVLNVLLPQSSENYQRDALLLEPSFYGQVLGIEGRMDLLQHDFRLLLEQKAGQGAFYRKDEESPRAPQESHRIQVLLYQALLRYMFLLESDATDTFLLYSKYPKGLLRSELTSSDLYRAITLRNEIVWYEEQYRRGGFRILLQLTPDAFHRSENESKLWTDYRAPKLQQWLDSFQTASSLEQQYFLRLARSVAEEQWCAKLGSGATHTGFASKWLTTALERMASGNMLSHLSLRLEADGDGRYAVLELQTEGGAFTLNSNFRVGDIVVVYSCAQGRVPDIRDGIAFKGRVLAIEAHNVRVALTHPQMSRLAWERPSDTFWVLESDINESSYTSQYQGLYLFLQSSVARRELILGTRHPATASAAQSLRGEYGELDHLVMRSRQAKELFLILGPPGTGKTSHVLMSLLREELLDPAGCILLTAFTNRALDEICSKLCAAEIDFIHLGTQHSCAPEFHSYLLEEKVAKCQSVEEIRELITQCRVFCGNTSRITSQRALFKLKRFSLAIVDEASQLLETQLLPLFCANEAAGEHPIQRFVLIGDHKQLPAIAQQADEKAEVTEHELQAIGLENCKTSFFERFYRRYPNDPSVTYFLTKQARMHEDIVAFVNYNFYQGRLVSRHLPHQHKPLPVYDIEQRTGSLLHILARRRFFWVGYVADAPAQAKWEEAKLIAQLVADFVTYFTMRGESFLLERDLGIVVPYRRQINAIRIALQELSVSGAESLTIDTVERYQGSERKVIIYGLTAQTPQELTFLTQTATNEQGYTIDRKLNVALTRARDHLVLLGNMPLLLEDHSYYKLWQYTRRKGSYVQVLGGSKVADRNFCLSTPIVRTSEQVFDPSLLSAFVEVVLRPLETPNPQRGGLALNSLKEEFIENIVGYGCAPQNQPIELVMGESLVTQLTPWEQLLLWAKVLLPEDYLHARELQQRRAIPLQLAAQGSPVVSFLEFGNNIAGILAFLAAYQGDRSLLQYYGIAFSAALQKLLNALLRRAYPDLPPPIFYDDEQLLTDVWEVERSSTIVIHHTHLYRIWSAERLETWAQILERVPQEYPKHRYIFYDLCDPLEAQMRGAKRVRKALDRLL